MLLGMHFRMCIHNMTNAYTHWLHCVYTVRLSVHFRSRYVYTRQRQCVYTVVGHVYKILKFLYTMQAVYTQLGILERWLSVYTVRQQDAPGDLYVGEDDGGEHIFCHKLGCSAFETVNAT